MPKKNDIFLRSSKDLLELTKKLKSLWKAMESEDRLSVIKKLCSNPTLEGVSIEYHLKKPFQILENIKNLREKSNGARGGSRTPTPCGTRS